MNRILSAIALAVAAVAAAPAFADDITPEPPFASTRSRAEVIAEMQQFQRDGMNPWADQYDQLQAFTGTKTRAQVVAEFMNSRDEVAGMNAEDSGAAYMMARSQRLPQVFAGEPVNAQ